MPRSLLGPLAAWVLLAAPGCGASYSGPLDESRAGGGQAVGTGSTIVPPTVEAPSGSAAPAVVEDALRRQNGRLRSCWDRLMLEHPELTDGRAIVRFQLDPSGRVLGVELLSGPVEDPSFRTCVEEQARGMRFPQGDAASVFSHSFTFGVSAGAGVE